MGMWNQVQSLWCGALAHLLLLLHFVFHFGLFEKRLKRRSSFYCKSWEGEKAEGRSSFHCKTWEEKRAEGRLIFFLSQTWEVKKKLRKGRLYFYCETWEEKAMRISIAFGLQMRLDVDHHGS